MSLLSVDGLSVKYGAVRALNDASLHVDDAELVVIVGANGAGKSSLLRAVSGLTKASAGSVSFAGRTITGASAESRVRSGLSLVPEGRHIFGRMTVQENLQIATWASKRRLKDEIERIHTLFPVLAERAHQVAATLSGGEQQMLAISRALVRRPKLLMLDEPSMGLAPLIVKQMFELIADVNAQGTSVLLVEQNARMALSIAHRGYLMETATLSGGGSASAMADDESLHAAYFGRSSPSP
ncbi:ABC transporter ATP-binding protein [Herbiconiux sp.]|uniref:ABC transporter ATP-binding protein n=1 Tax=Herbiconiux sp. TaxID=1871186 RepID=UPI0025BB9639|nr:ABC transporter ATP-binding protein [Herbiconiux sp.]